MARKILKFKAQRQHFIDLLKYLNYSQNNIDGYMSSIELILYSKHIETVSPALERQYLGQEGGVREEGRDEERFS